MTKEVKLVEIRDSMTFVPAMAIQVSGEDGYLMRRAGFGNAMVYLVLLATEKARYDPFNWDTRTISVVHQWIEAHWDTVKDGDVVDVQFILGETQEPKVSEQVSLVTNPETW
jgi:hypothetical protein